jgi:hypothetical protein
LYGNDDLFLMLLHHAGFITAAIFHVYFCFTFDVVVDGKDEQWIHCDGQHDE